MRSNDSRGSGRRQGRGPRRSSRGRREDARPNSNATTASSYPAVKRSFWQWLVAFFRPAAKPGEPITAQVQTARPAKEARTVRKPEAVEVTSPKLYVGNLSYDATESDLLELFNGVGAVKSAEIVSHKYNEKSKGFGFVTMTTTDEAKRAVTELHDKEFMGRKLVVSGAKTGEREPNYRG